MLIENRENECHKAGCPDLCCRNMWFKNISTIEREKVFPDARYSPLGADFGPDRVSCGVYIIAERSGRELVYLNGNCPHLCPDGCDGLRSEICDKFKFGETDCNRIRNKWLNRETANKSDLIHTVKRLVNAVRLK